MPERRTAASPDALASMICGFLARHEHNIAARLTVVFRPRLGQDAAVRELLDGDTDLAIAVLDREIENIETRTLFDAEYVVAMRRLHPAAAAVNRDAWLSYPHVVVSGRGDWRTPLDPHLAAMGYRRRVGLVVPTFQLVPAVLAATDMKAMLPRQSIAAHAHPDLALYPPPVTVDGFRLTVAWHKRQNVDRAVQHVCRIVRETFETILVPSVMPREG